ncbi:protein Smaug homolog 1 isoform X1 [Apteryx mantelli]|uniref:Protein Smaug homolog 1 n=1 Tax=Apteryx mantelli TaxID=2696672 RepID=A0ABM4EEX7_9AVES
MMFRDQVGVLAGWFKGWNECEQTVALLSLLKRVSRTQARFLQLCLEHSLADCTELHILEGEANNPGIINQWQQESKDKVISLLLTHLPLLKPGNIEAKVEYMKLLPKILAHSIEHNQHIEESRQLLSYALIHPATSLEDRSALAMWLNHLEDRTSGSFGSQNRGRSDSVDYGQTHYYHQRQNSDDKLNGWQNSRDSGISVSASSWQDKNLACENGHLPLYSSSSVPTTINTIGTSTSTILSGQTHHSPLKRSVSLTPPMNVPNQPLGHGWMSHEDLRARGPQCIPSDHAPLSPQSSVASSGSGGSEHLEDQPSARNTFQEEGSGMKDVPAWLKSLRLHKYAALFSQMTYEEMMALTECQLEAQNVTKGARHKIVISIQKLKERQNLLKSLERDILEGGNLRVPLQELHQMILTPIKAYCSQNSNADEHSRDPDSHHPSSLIGSDSQGSDCKDSAAGAMQQHHLPGCEGESGGAPLPEGDLPGQFTRVMGKVCTQLLVSRPDEENISSYLQLIDKCLIHEPRLWPVELLADSWLCRCRNGQTKPPAIPDPLPQPPHRPAGAAGARRAAGHGPAQRRRQPRHPQARQTEPLVRQPRRQQQHAQPDPQLGAEDALAAGSHLPADHADVSAARVPGAGDGARHQQQAGVPVPEHDGARAQRWCRPNLDDLGAGATVATLAGSATAAGPAARCGRAGGLLGGGPQLPSRSLLLAPVLIL